MQLKKDMQKEINKYQGRIFYYNTETRTIQIAEWIKSLSDYNHFEYELHHFVPFYDWEKNIKNIQSKVNNKLILLPKIMHQHLENPIYKLSKEKFQEIYGINSDEILFDVNSKLPRVNNDFIEPSQFIYDDCFEDCCFLDEIKKYRQKESVCVG